LEIKNVAVNKKSRKNVPRRFCMIVRSSLLDPLTLAAADLCHSLRRSSRLASLLATDEVRLTDIFQKSKLNKYGKY